MLEEKQYSRVVVLLKKDIKISRTRVDFLSSPTGFVLKTQLYGQHLNESYFSLRARKLYVELELASEWELDLVVYKRNQILRQQVPDVNCGQLLRAIQSTNHLSYIGFVRPMKKMKSNVDDERSQSEL